MIAGVRIRNLYKAFQVAGKHVQVFKGLELELDASRITVVLGRSGCGKTTLLRVVSGLETYDSGEICLEDGIRLGIVFQEPRLMPWLNVRQNITFGLKKKEIDGEEIDGLIAMTGLDGFERAYPSQLSGGMQQRAALARALSHDPSYILMDEPFAALDYFTRKSMQDELLRIQQKNQKGVLFVTHSIDEALTLGHRIVVLEDGRCGMQLDLEDQPYPRELLSEDMIEIKKKIIKRIGE